MSPCCEVISSFVIAVYFSKFVSVFLLVINTNLPPILHRFQLMVKFSLARGEPLRRGGGGLNPMKGFPWDDLREIFTERSRMAKAKVPNGVEILPNISIAWVGRTNVTDDRRQTDRQTDRRWHIANVFFNACDLERKFTVAENPVKIQNLVFLTLKTLRYAKRRHLTYWS